jgi:hypothetical protein
MTMLDVEYLYLGGPYDGQWRHTMGGTMGPADIGPERYRNEAGSYGRYIPTKFGHMAAFGEGQFRMSCVVMLDEPWHTILSTITEEGTPEHVHRRRLERALTMQAFREHLQRTWRAEEMLKFSDAWAAMERRP